MKVFILPWNTGNASCIWLFRVVSALSVFGHISLSVAWWRQLHSRMLTKTPNKQDEQRFQIRFLIFLDIFEDFCKKLHIVILKAFMRIKNQFSYTTHCSQATVRIKIAG